MHDHRQDPFFVSSLGSISPALIKLKTCTVPTADLVSVRIQRFPLDKFILLLAGLLALVAICVSVIAPSKGGAFLLLPIGALAFAYVQRPYCLVLSMIDGRRRRVCGANVRELWRFKEALERAIRLPGSVYGERGAWSAGERLYQPSFASTPSRVPPSRMNS